MPGFDETENEIKYRIRDPSKYKKFRRKNIEKGVDLVLGIITIDGKSKTEVQSIAFNKKYFDMKQAKAWVQAHPGLSEKFSISENGDIVLENVKEIFVAEIAENETEEGVMKVKGTAIEKGVSRNGVEYSAEELKKTKFNKNTPILKDHNNSVDAIIGSLKKVQYVDEGQKIIYTGIINDKEIQEKIKDKRIRCVSVGLMLAEITKPKDAKNYVAKGLELVELSAVAVPGIANASIGIAEKFEEIQNVVETFDKLDVNKIKEEIVMDNETNETVSKMQEQIETLKKEIKNNSGVPELKKEMETQIETVKNETKEGLNAIMKRLSEMTDAEAEKTQAEEDEKKAKEETDEKEADEKEAEEKLKTLQKENETLEKKLKEAKGIPKGKSEEKTNEKTAEETNEGMELVTKNTREGMDFFADWDKSMTANI